MNNYIEDVIYWELGNFIQFYNFFLEEEENPGKILNDE